MPEVDKCPKCQTPILDTHPYSWCTKCGEPLPESINAKLVASPSSPVGRSDEKQTAEAKGQNANHGASAFGALIFIAIVAYFGYQSLNAPANRTSDLVVQEHHLAREGGINYVAGTILNTGNTTFGYAQVEINLYDAAGAQIGSTLANVNNLSPGVTWKFKAVILQEGVSRYEIKGVTAF